MEGIPGISRRLSMVAMVLTIAVAAASMAGAVVTGFYPGMVILWLMPLVPIVTRMYAKKLEGRSASGRQNFIRVITVMNMLVILVVVWMTFVILVDRVFPRVI